MATSAKDVQSGFDSAMVGKIKMMFSQVASQSTTLISTHHKFRRLRSGARSNPFALTPSELSPRSIDEAEDELLFFAGEASDLIEAEL